MSSCQESQFKSPRISQFLSPRKKYGSPVTKPAESIHKRHETQQTANAIWNSIGLKMTDVQNG
jgi:hypothetical protein